jgi:hypothetical protein
MHSIVYKYSPKSLHNMIQTNVTRELAYELRNNNLIYVPNARIDLFKRFPLYSLPTLWNSFGDGIYYSNPVTFSIATKMQLFSELNE